MDTVSDSNLSAVPLVKTLTEEPKLHPTIMELKTDGDMKSMELSVDQNTREPASMENSTTESTSMEQSTTESMSTAQSSTESMIMAQSSTESTSMTQSSTESTSIAQSSTESTSMAQSSTDSMSMAQSKTVQNTKQHKEISKTEIKEDQMETVTAINSQDTETTAMEHNSTELVNTEVLLSNSEEPVDIIKQATDTSMQCTAIPELMPATAVQIKKEEDSTDAKMRTAYSDSDDSLKHPRSAQPQVKKVMMTYRVPGSSSDISLGTDESSTDSSDIEAR